MSSGPVMPGGPIASRPLHFFWIVDASGSMAYEGKVQALNTAVREAIPHMRDAAESQPQAEVFVRVLSFSEDARWIVEQPTPIAEFRWTDVRAGGTTDLGRALELLSAQLRVPPMSERALPPVLALISDGQPTDDFEGGLQTLMNEPWGQRAVRVAIAIGRDADESVLQRFIGDPKIQPARANNPEQLVRYVRWASTLITPVSQPPRVGDSISTAAPPDPLPGIGDVTW